MFYLNDFLSVYFSSHMPPHLAFFCIFTARKQSLRRLCFHRCLSVHRGGRGFRPRGSLSSGVVSVQCYIGKIKPTGIE